MKIIYFYQYFTTPKGSYGTRVYEFTKDWVKRGHEVTVVTSVYSKSDIRSKKFLETQVIDGIKLKIININIDNKQSFLKRILTFFIYSIFSIYYALTLKYDVVISSSGPITAGIPGVLAKIIRKKKFVFEVRDLWPEVAIELKILNNKFLQRISYFFEEMCYKKSSLVIALSEGMKSNIIERFPKTNVTTVTNSANLQLFSSNYKKISHPILASKKFAIYSGNIGKVNNSEILLRAAIVLNKLRRNDIVILLIGDGQLKQEIIEKSLGLETIIILDPISKIDLVNYVKNSFVSLIPLDDVPVLSTSSPNKLFESMAAGVPIIQTTSGWIKDMLIKSDSGFTVCARNENELVEKIIFLADNKQRTKQLGENAHNYAKNNFNKNFLARKMIKSIEEII